jgi:hypothetical protein
MHSRLDCLHRVLSSFPPREGGTRLQELSRLLEGGCSMAVFQNGTIWMNFHSGKGGQRVWTQEEIGEGI